MFLTQTNGRVDTTAILYSKKYLIASDNCELLFQHGDQRRLNKMLLLSTNESFKLGIQGIA